MSKSPYITSLKLQSGKSIVALGVMEQLLGHREFCMLPAEQKKL